METKISFDSLPQEIFKLGEKLERIEKILDKKLTEQSHLENDTFISPKAAATFLDLKTSTIYQKVHSGILPHIKKGKKLYFSTKELIKYLESGKVSSLQELDQKAANFLNAK